MSFRNGGALHPASQPTDLRIEFAGERATVVALILGTSSGHRLIWWGRCDVDLQSNASQDHIA